MSSFECLVNRPEFVVVVSEAVIVVVFVSAGRKSKHQTGLNPFNHLGDIDLSITGTITTTKTIAITEHPPGGLIT